MKLGQETGSLINHVLSTTTSAEPAVGLGATVLGWTDRHAGTIIEVRPNGSFVVQEDSWARADGNGSAAQSYSYEPNLKGRTFEFARVLRGRAKGQFREGGRTTGYGVMVGRRDRYHDFSF